MWLVAARQSVLHQEKEQQQQQQQQQHTHDGDLEWAKENWEYGMWYKVIQHEEDEELDEELDEQNAEEAEDEREDLEHDDVGAEMKEEGDVTWEKKRSENATKEERKMREEEETRMRRSRLERFTMEERVVMLGSLSAYRDVATTFESKEKQAGVMEVIETTSSSSSELTEDEEEEEEAARRMEKGGDSGGDSKVSSICGVVLENSLDSLEGEWPAKEMQTRKMKMKRRKKRARARATKRSHSSMEWMWVLDEDVSGTGWAFGGTEEGWCGWYPTSWLERPWGDVWYHEEWNHHESNPWWEGGGEEEEENGGTCFEAVACAPFFGESEIELSFEKGERVDVYDGSGEEWWYGRLRQRSEQGEVETKDVPLQVVEGYFPCSFVVPVV